MDDTRDVIRSCEFSLLIVSVLAHKYVQLIPNGSVKTDAWTTTAMRWSNIAVQQQRVCVTNQLRRISSSAPPLPPPHPFHSVLLLFFSSFLILILFLLFLESELEIAADDCDIVRFSVKWAAWLHSDVPGTPYPPSKQPLTESSVSMKSSLSYLQRLPSWV